MNYLDALNGRHAISVRAWLLLLPISVFMTRTFVPDGAQGTYVQWMGLGFAAHAITGAVLWVGWMLLRYVTRPTVATAVVLATFVCAGALRGLSVSYLGDLLDLIATPDYASRMRSGATLVTVWFGFAAVLTDTNARYRVALRDVARSAEQALALARDAQKHVKEYRQQVVSTVESMLSSAFASVRTPSQLTGVIDLLLGPVKDKSALAAVDEQLATAGQRLSRGRQLSLRQTFRTMIWEVPFNWSAVAFVFLASTASSRWWVSSPGVFVADIVLNLLWIYVIVRGARSLMDRVPALPRPLLVLVAWLIVAVGCGAITESLGAGSLVLASGALSNFAIAVIVVFILTSALDAYRLQLSRKKVELDALGRQITWHRRVINQSLWLERRHLTRLIHSQIQAQILATAHRIARQSPDRDITAEELDELSAVCRAAIHSTGEDPDVERFLAEIAEVFSGATQITSSVSPQASALIATNPAAGAATLEVIREGINNAVKHGHARDVRVNIDAAQDSAMSTDLVVVRVENDEAEGLIEPTRGGLGQQTLEELAVDWALDRVEGRATLTVKVPVAAGR